MRASTLFALTAAVLIGLGVAVTAKMGGFFNKPVEQVKRSDVQVLVAARNIFSGDMINATDIKLRNLKPTEQDSFNKHPEQYLPNVPAAAYQRVAKQNIEADTPITRDLLKEFIKPAPLNERLLPDHRAVDVVLPKDRSAGGLVQVGEWVDLYMTSNIQGREGGGVTRTAAIAPRVRVIAKRDTLWPLYAPLPKDKPVEYTLEINSYRAALIEFARGKGVLSMSPLPAGEQKKLEAERNEKLARMKNGDVIVESAPEGQEATEEMHSVQGGDSGGDHVITEAALVKLFELKDPPPEPPPATTSIEQFSGVRRVGEAVFTLEGKPYLGSTGFEHGGGHANNGNYPPYPYSSNVSLITGKMIPNNRLANYANIIAVGRDRNTQGGFNASLGNGFGGGATFKTPDCPTCKDKARKAY
jgi:Flp pilus assembly protein CpaB